MPQERKKILFISTIRLFPAQVGGQIRPAVFSQALADLGYEVEIYSFTARRDDYARRLPAYTHEPVPGIREFVDTSFLHLFLNQFFKMLKAPPIWSLLLTYFGYCPASLRLRLKEADFVISEFLFTMSANNKLTTAPWFMDSHNLEFQREAGQGGIHLLYGRVLRAIEKRAPKSYQGILACTHDEIAFFNANSSKDHPCAIVHIPNGIAAIEYLDSDPAKCVALRHELVIGDQERVFLFCGSNYYANNDAVAFLRRFSQKYDSWLKENNILFVVVGGVESNFVRCGQYLATSFVDDPKKYYKMADYMINPMELGSGTNIKVAEAIAANLPILSTTFGMRGFDVDKRDDYITFERETLQETLAQVMLADYNSIKLRAIALRKRLLPDIDGMQICLQRIKPFLVENMHSPSRKMNI